MLITKYMTNLDGTSINWKTIDADITIRTLEDIRRIGYYPNVVLLRDPGIVALVNNKRNHAIILLPNGETIQSPISIKDDKSFMLN